MKLSGGIALLIFLILIGSYLLYKRLDKNKRTYNWNLELTKPLDYDMVIKNISYRTEGKEIFRSTTLNNRAGWSGIGIGRVLYDKINEFLPDTVQVAWEEKNTDSAYTLEFAFPKQQVLDYWNANYGLLKQKYGADYPKGQLSLRLGLAPEGQVTLWMSDLDTNTTGFALEVAAYRASDDKTKGKPVETTPGQAIGNRRFGPAHFYAFEGENVVSIYVDYQNGEAHTISQKSESNSILAQMNSQRGWGIAKSITVTWFDKSKQGYRSTYEVELSATAVNTILELPQTTPFIYLLDRPNEPSAEWNRLSENYIFQLSEVKRTPFG